jgi:hypothetical protein
MDPQIVQDFEAAGYQVDGDAVILQLGPNAQVRANDLSHLLDACAGLKTDPIKVVQLIMEKVRAQPNVKMAVETGAKCDVNVSLKNVQVRPKS